MTDDDSMDPTHRTNGRTDRTRRAFLGAAGLTGATSLVAGCLGSGGDGTATPTGGTDDGTDATTEGSDGDNGDGGTDGGDGGTEGGNPSWYGSGPGEFAERPPPGGTSMDDMPDLSGTLKLYSGRGQALVGNLLTFLEEKYPDFTVDVTYNTASTLARTIVTEGQNTPADVFYSVNAGALASLAAEGRTRALAEETTGLVGQEFRPGDGSWVGTSGRARTVPYNTETLSESDLPTDIMAYPDVSGYDGEIGWAPVYSSFQGFVAAMIALEGEQATREWIRGMQDLNVQSYSDESAIVQAVADGELAFGLTNHYYIQRILAGRPNAPLATHFTSGDAGSVFNVAGAARIDSTDQPELADLFVRHLLSAEAQEYFAVRTFEYPLVDGVEPVGRLPSISELDVPDIDLSNLSNLERTVTILREEGVL